MWSASVPNQSKAGPWLFGGAVVCGVLGVVLARYSVAAPLCHLGVPLTIPVVALPIIAAILGVVSLFYPPSSRALLAAKLLVIIASAYQFFVALISLTGMGLIACG